MEKESLSQKEMIITLLDGGKALKYTDAWGNIQNIIMSYDLTEFTDPPKPTIQERRKQKIAEFLAAEGDDE